MAQNDRENNASGVEMIHTPIIFRNLKPAEIECRVQSVYDKTVRILLYKNARVDMNILDETIGCANWQRAHQEIKGNLFCGVAIRENGDSWIWKWDCGTESNTEKEKGEASDAFKRACFCWGIGRELYTAPPISITLKDKDFFKGKVCQSFSVKEIEINANKEITYLTIEDKWGNVRFEWGKKRKPLTSAQLKKVIERLYNGEDIWQQLRDNFIFDEQAIQNRLRDYALSKNTF